MHRVQLAEQVELFALLLERQLRVADVGYELVHPHVGRDDAGGLKLGGEEAVAPKRGTDHDLCCRAQHNVTGQVPVLGAKAIEQPGPHRRPDGLDVASVHLQQRRFMVRHVRLHRTDNAAIVNDAPEVRQCFAHFDAAPAAFPELQRRRHEAGALGFLVKIAARLLAFVLHQGGLGIKCIHVRWSPV